MGQNAGYESNKGFALAALHRGCRGRGYSRRARFAAWGDGSFTHVLALLLGASRLGCSHGEPKGECE